MKIIIKILTFLAFLFSIGVFLNSSTNIFASDCGMFPLADGCTSNIHYCNDSDSKCSLSGGTEVVGGVLQNTGISTNETFTEYITRVVKYLLSFVTIIGVIYVIWAGFQLMTGAGDEEKSKKAKNIIIYVVIGIIVMWLAYSIVTFIIGTVRTTSFIPRVMAAEYTENDSNTFNEYKRKLQTVREDIETELRVNGRVSSSLLQTVRGLVNEAYNTLPDDPESSVTNDSLKKGVDLYIQLAEKNPGSTNDIAKLISGIGTFVSSAAIEQITGQIEASPVSGNAPLTVTLRATNVKDPKGVVPGRDNFIWWMRGNGGVRRELGRGPTFTYTFKDEQTYTVFLDIVSGSRNRKGRTDVLPFSESKQIEVQPRIGNITLFINGVNVSDLSTFKISPAIAKSGLLIDATASRGSNGTVIEKTTWNFGNTNEITYKGAPQIERQIYANEGKYPISLKLVNNEGTAFGKDITLLVVEPASVIQVDKTTGFIGDVFRFSAISYFSKNTNIAYRWEIFDLATDKKLVTSDGISTNYTFQKVGRYAVSLYSRSPNGKEDKDSKEITIESKDPVINLEVKNQNKETPNTFVFDASRSYDPDTAKTDGLTYNWRVDGASVDLDNKERDGAIGTYTFPTLGDHTVSLSITNTSGKIATIEKKVTVDSLLSVSMEIDPLVSRIGSVVNIGANAPNAAFYEWSISDKGSDILGSEKNIQHVFKQSGSYNVSLTVRSQDGKQTNTIVRKVYATDGMKPFALIQVKNGQNLIEEAPNTCNDESAFIIDRKENITLDGGLSTNVDGTTSGLSYTWKYNGKSLNTKNATQKFDELGCFPIELTVRSDKNGSMNSIKKYINVRNLSPKLTSITATRDTQTKVNSQKVLINVAANAARDDDGVIVNYIWYYYTDSDPDPQNIRITQKPNTVFVVPNITEKYYFGVILEDNDGAKTNSRDENTDAVPLLISNDDGNINIPLISLTTGNTTINAGESITFSTTAKTILGKDITNQSEYLWDFNGDGIIDKKGTEPRVSYTYTSAGTMNMKVKVVYNGVSNTKYQTIYVKNELSPNVSVYRMDNKIYAVNTSLGIFNKAKWTLGDYSSDSLYGISYDFGSDPLPATGGKLEITDTSGESKEIEFPIATLSNTPVSKDKITILSLPENTNDTIFVKNKSDRVTLMLFPNQGTKYTIDEDIRIDSNLDGIGDNDIDNISSDSYLQGSPYNLTSIGNPNSREQTMKISIYDGEVLRGSKNVKIVFEYIPEGTSETGSVLDTGKISSFDKDTMDSLSSKIRSLSSDDRAVLMQKYNLLVENWEDPTEKTKLLIDIQEYTDSSGLAVNDKTEISNLLNTLLVGDGLSSDQVSIAGEVIKNLIPSTNASYSKIQSNLELIKSHPNNLTENKKLGTEILELIKDDTTIEDKYKLLIKDQLKIIVNGGQTISETPTDTASAPSTNTNTGGSAIVSFIKGFVKIFLIIIGLILFIFFLGFIWYSLSKKKENIGFQDFIIDSIFHGGQKVKTQEVSTNPQPVVVPEQPKNREDPLKTMMNQDPLREDPLQTLNQQESTTSIGISRVDQMVDIKKGETTESSVPDWLKVNTGAPSIEPIVPFPINEGSIGAQEATVVPAPETRIVGEESPWNPDEGKKDLISLNEANVNTTQVEGTIPDWLKPPVSSNQNAPTDGNADISKFTQDVSSVDVAETNISSSSGVGSSPSSTENSVPDWLLPRNETENILPETSKTSEEIVIPEPSLGEKGIKETPTAGDKLPDWLTASAEISTTEMVNNEAGAKKKTPKEKTTDKKTSTDENMTQQSTSSKDLPDWLK